MEVRISQTACIRQRVETASHQTACTIQGYRNASYTSQPGATLKRGAGGLVFDNDYRLTFRSRNEIVISSKSDRMCGKMRNALYTSQPGVPRKRCQQVFLQYFRTTFVQEDEIRKFKRLITCSQKCNFNFRGLLTIL